MRGGCTTIRATPTVPLGFHTRGSGIIVTPGIAGGIGLNLIGLGLPTVEVVLFYR